MGAWALQQKRIVASIAMASGSSCRFASGQCKERSKRTVGGGYTIPNVAELVVTVDLSVVVANACEFLNKSTATAGEPKTGGKLECNKRAQ